MSKSCLCFLSWYYLALSTLFRCITFMTDTIFKTLNTTQLAEVQKQIYEACQEGGAVVTVKIGTIKTKQFRSLHLWFRQCEDALNAGNVSFYGGLSGKPRRWQDGDFKAGIYKPFLRHYKGLDSTTKQGSNTVNDASKRLQATSLLNMA